MNKDNFEEYIPILKERLAKNTREENGHVIWTGKLNNDGNPITMTCNTTALSPNVWLHMVSIGKRKQNT
jgi:hypothetical protein